MNDTNLTTSQPGPEKIQTWLTERVAHYLQLPPENIDPEEPLADYGLESVYALALCGDIEDEFGLTVEATLLWDVADLTALVARIIELTAEQRP